MDKLKNFRNKTKSEGSSNPGLINKLTKRYSNVSSKILRRSPGRTESPQPISGSYDMTGGDSDDHKPEIGAPILISKTMLDSDYLDPIIQLQRRSSNLSTDSDNEVFADAKSSNSNQIGEIQFKFFPDSTNECIETKLTIEPDYDILPSSVQTSHTSTLRRSRSKSANNICKTELQVYLQKTPSLEFKQVTKEDEECCYDFPKINIIPNTNNNNLHNVNSTNYNANINDKNTDIIVDTNKSKTSETETKKEANTEKEIEKDKSKEITSESKQIDYKNDVKKIDLTDIEVAQVAKDTIAHDLFLSIEKLNRTSQFVLTETTVANDNKQQSSPINNEEIIDESKKTRSGSNTPIQYNSNVSLNKSLNNNDVRYLSKESFRSDCSSKDFDMKSVSFESLNIKDEEFLSLAELDWIKEEFNRSIDLEYCDHRDKLKPNERRITLLRNKNSRLVNLGDKKEKISNAWSGLKNWIGEEKGKIKEVVQRHAALQRVGAGKQTIVKNQAFFDKVLVQNRKKNLTIERVDDEETTPTACSSNTISQRTSIYSSVKLANNSEDLQSADNNEQIMKSDNQSTISIAGKSKKTESSSGWESQAASETGASHVTKCESEDRGGFNPFLKKHKTNELIEGQNGFEELRRYVKQGGDFGKELVVILQERIESEQLYSKSLSKMASKLNKACREIPGSIADAWRNVATEMESRGDVHRQFSNSLNEDIVKPLKNILDNHHKTRKTIESSVDKSSRILSEWRVSEAKSKKNSHTAARENEKLQDAMLDVRITRSPSIALLHHGQGHNKSPEKDTKSTEKDCAKLDNKRRKAEEAVKRADVEYYTLCIRSERARVDWEMAVLRGSTILQSLENQRLSNLKDYVTSYLKLSTNMNPIIDKVVDRLTSTVLACNTQKDLIVVRNIRRASEGPSEQLLPDFYCEHTTLAMNRERRKQALVKLLQLVRQDLERERRSRNGLKGLSQTLTDSDCQNITDKLYHIRSMLTYLEGARYKLQSALFELDHKPRGSHPLAPHIQITRDRTGLQQSILKVPLWLKNNEDDNESQISPTKDENLDCIDTLTTSQTLTNCIDIKNEVLIKKFGDSFTRSKSSLEFGNTKDISVIQNGKSNTLSENSNDSSIWDRGIADGNSNQPDSDFDEFSSQDEDEDNSKKELIIKSSPVVIGKCKALYSYTPKLYDELELTPGDIIEVHAKQEDGWWLGATKNHVGIFPATYVEEII